MNRPANPCNRREFNRAAVLSGPAFSLGTATTAFGVTFQKRRIKTGVIGCGSVSHSYLPVLSKCPYVELVSVCDIRPERAQAQARRFRVTHHYRHIDEMLAGAPFDFLVVLTDMQEHEHLN